MDVTTISDADRVELMEQAFSAVDEVCAQLELAEWDLPTDCPHWSVKDNLSHLVSFEGAATGTPLMTEVDVSGLGYLKDDFQRMNEREVEGRRARSGPDVLAEFRDVTAKRVRQLGALDDAGWETEMTTPVGKMQQRNALGIRILDVFYHEQDIRRATGRAGHLDGAVAQFVFEWMATRALPRVAGKAAPDGATVVFDVAKPGRAIAIAVEGGKGAVVAEAPNPTTTLAMDFEAFFMLLGGRKTAGELTESKRLAVSGDEGIAARVLDDIAVVP
jgi:uncharacterized protein (TIGR03083 family)